MVRPPQSAGTDCPDRGFALIIVLWTLVLVAFITIQLVASGRVETRIAGNIVANAVVQAAADGAVYQTIFNLLEPDPARRWPLDGSTRELVIGDCRATVRLDDEAARVNPSLASPALLEALLQVAGSDADHARQLAAAVGEWVGAPGAARTQSAMQADYRAAGRDYAPPGEPLEALDELQRVTGITPAIYAAIRPHLSLYAGAAPSVRHADPVIASAMALLAEAGPASQTPPLQLPSDVLTVRIAVTAQGPNKASVSRTAIVRVTPLSQSYTILAWDSGD
jgi:general secretion pathway protein K